MQQLWRYKNEPYFLTLIHRRHVIRQRIANEITTKWANLRSLVFNHGAEKNNNYRKTQFLLQLAYDLLFESGIKTSYMFS